MQVLRCFLLTASLIQGATKQVAVAGTECCFWWRGAPRVASPTFDLRSRKENFFLCSCGDFSVPLKQCDVLWRFFFRSLNFGPFSLIAPKREAEERLNSEQQELSSLQSELIDAEVRLCTCQVAFMYWNSFEFQGQSIFFCIFHSTFKLSWCDLRPGQRAASKTLKRNRKLSTRQPDSICIRKADLNRKSLVPNEIDDWQATSLVSMLRVELNSEQAKWKSWKFKSIFFRNKYLFDPFCEPVILRSFAPSFSGFAGCAPSRRTSCNQTTGALPLTGTQKAPREWSIIWITWIISSKIRFPYFLSVFSLFPLCFMRIWFTLAFMNPLWRGGRETKRVGEDAGLDADRHQKLHRNLPQISSLTVFFVSFSTFQEMNDGLVDDLNTKGCFWHDSQISF